MNDLKNVAVAEKIENLKQIMTRTINRFLTIEMHEREQFLASVSDRKKKPFPRYRNNFIFLIIGDMTRIELLAWIFISISATLLPGQFDASLIWVESKGLTNKHVHHILQPFQRFITSVSWQQHRVLSLHHPAITDLRLLEVKISAGILYMILIAVRRTGEEELLGLGCHHEHGRHSQEYLDLNQNHI